MPIGRLQLICLNYFFRLNHDLDSSMRAQVGLFSEKITQLPISTLELHLSTYGKCDVYLYQSNDYYNHDKFNRV
jgi:hypothetical protein